MYPKNAASPEPIAIGAVIRISDGAVQASGCTVRIKPIGVAEGDGGGTTAYSTDGIVLYTPTQAETDYTSFILIAQKTSCIPVSITVITTSSATPGTVLLAPVTHTSAVIPRVTLTDTTTTNTDMRGTDSANTVAPATPTNVSDVQTAVLAKLPAALTANGNMKSSLVEIITTAITEGVAGRIAAAWQGFWNVATPTGNVNSLPSAVPGNSAGLPRVSDVPTTAQMEAAILNEGDATALLAAIAAKVEQFLINEGDATATIAAIATACNAAIAAGTVGTNAATAATQATTAATQATTAATQSTAAAGTASTINTKIGTPAVSVSADIAAVAANATTSATQATTAATQASAAAVDAAAVKVVTDKLATAIVLDGAVYQFTANALELAPTGGGGGGGAGTGARTVTITVNDGVTVLENATVRMTEGANTYTVLTNVSGVAVFNLDDATYVVSISKAGYIYAGTTLLVNGTEAETYSLTLSTIVSGTYMCTRSDLEQVFGTTALAAWADLNNNGNASEIAARIEHRISMADNYVRATLSNSAWVMPSAGDVLPSILSYNVAALAGVYLYEGRGVQDYNAAGYAQHQLSYHKKNVEDFIKGVLVGSISLEPLVYGLYTSAPETVEAT